MFGLQNFMRQAPHCRLVVTILFVAAQIVPNRRFNAFTVVPQFQSNTRSVGNFVLGSLFRPIRAMPLRLLVPRRRCRPMVCHLKIRFCIVLFMISLLMRGLPGR